MNILKPLASALIAASVFAGALGAAGQARASGLTDTEIGILAGTGGFLLGTIVNESTHHRRHVIYVDSWDAHVSRCYARYRTYDEGSDTYIGRDGYEHRCRL